MHTEPVAFCAPSVTVQLSSAFVKVQVKPSFEQLVSIIIAARHDKNNFFIYRPFSVKFCKM